MMILVVQWQLLPMPGQLQSELRASMLMRGFAKVFRTSNNSGIGMQLGETICGDASGEMFGQSVDITANGNPVVIGSPVYWEFND